MFRRPSFVFGGITKSPIVPPPSRRSCSHAMAPASTSDVPDNNLQLGLVRHIQKLRKEYNLILRREKSLARKRRQLRSSKSSVVACIDLYEKLSKELSSRQHELVSTSGSMEVDDADPPCSGAKRGRGFADRQLRIQESSGLVEQENQSVGEPRPSMSGREFKKPRYLLVSSGYALCCLDLKQSKADPLIKKAHDVGPLPKVATLKLFEEGLPVSVGLFKLGSDVYMIGGQELLYLRELPDHSSTCMRNWGENPKGYNLYRTLSEQCTPKGTSHFVYRLSLAGSTLSHSECSNFEKLMEPKFWPIVEKIKGQIHVIDSTPFAFYNNRRDWIFSHQVLNNREEPQRHKMTRFPTFSEMEISSHLVVGDRIYGVCFQKSVVFDSNINKWKAIREGKNWYGNALTVEKVWHILKCGGIARCVGEYPLRVGKAAPFDLLYVIVAVVGASAFAYLVTSTRSVVCVQQLRDFYMEPVKPVDMCMQEGTMINVNDEEEDKTMCTVVNAAAVLNGRKVDSGKHYLFINIFSVEMLMEASSKVLEILEKGKYFWPVEQELVWVDVKHRHVFKTDTDNNGECDIPGFLPGVQACFM